MANSDNSSEHQAETNNPTVSTSYVPNTQPKSTVSSSSANVDENELSRLTEDLTLHHSATQPLNSGKAIETVSTSSLFTNVRENVNSEISNTNDSPNQGVAGNPKPGASKKKNAKKKERLKQLHMPQPAATSQQPQTAPAAPTSQQIKPEYFLPRNVASIQELFTRHIGPMYANTGSHYLENLSHHPQYQLMHNMQVRDLFQQQAHNVASAPNSPHVQTTPYHMPNSVHQQMDPRTPRYLQNVMQHPLLNKSYSVENYKQYQKQQQQQEIHYNMENTEEQSSTPRRKRRSRTKSKEGHVSDKKFGFYMHIKEVEAGLKNKTLVEGVLRINPKQFTHAYVSSSDRDEQDILIDGIKNRNRALEGDIVVVELVTECMNDDDDESENSKIDTSLDTINDGENAVSNSSNISNDPVHSRPDAKQKRGRVVYLKEKVHNRTCIGVLKLMADKNRQKALFVPRDHRIPRLNIPFTSWPDNFYQNSKSYENTLFLAKIIDWFDLRFATGKIIQSIGQSGDMITETKAILAQTDLDVTPFGREYRHLYPRLDYKIPEEEILLREDCRKLCIFSIDPSNCRDIDDAVSCRKLDNGNYEIGVHISDVSFFLTESTELDEKVAEKATTIYLVDKAYHMLPEELCMLCSLFPGVDKLAFSVFWEITENAEVLSHRFAKTVIHSCSQLAYEHAQAILEDREDAEISFPETYNGYQYKDIYETIKILGKIGAKFRQNRFENGALRIDQPKVAFHLNPFDGLPKSFWIYESKESHQLIEEFMLLANMTVAARIYKDHPNLAFLRCHPPPSGYMLKQLAKALKPMGIDLEISTAGDLQRSLLPYVAPDNVDKGRAMVLSMLCAKPMARAKYFCVDGVEDDDFHHYALNVPLYTHFTSPIRRYADIIVHRLLAASLSCKGSPRWEVDKIRMIAAQCNKQKYNAKKAGELSTELYTLKYIEMHSPIVTDAVVVEVREKYIDVIIVAMGLNRRIYFNNDFPGDFKCVKNDAGAKLSRMEIDWKKKDVPDAPPVKQVIEVFSIVKIEMTKGNDLVKVETKLVTPDENVQN
ncbi:DIS3-like exonuclease 2 [Choristoneura fumiferana]|uniref:DIS3-like exonuclease 2 n=1 Tax=Choristoneura fumiferana TaxID=7141 RepID=UPI003D15B0CE